MSEFPTAQKRLVTGPSLARETEAPSGKMSLYFFFYYLNFRGLVCAFTLLCAYLSY